MHTGEGGEGGTSCTPSEKFEKFDHKNAVKHENRGPLDFLTTPCTPSKEFENDCASKINLNILYEIYVDTFLLVFLL
jgi:hypothetical protein